MSDDVTAIVAKAREFDAAFRVLALADICERQAAELAALRMELEGERKANALLNAGMGSVCEGRDELKHELRTLRARLAALEAELRLEKATARFRELDGTDTEGMSTAHLAAHKRELAEASAELDEARRAAALVKEDTK